MKSADFNTSVISAIFDEIRDRWVLETTTGEKVIASYLITAVGCLSATQIPQIPGLEKFGGSWYHTGQWPHEDVNFVDKLVAVVGTGSSGIQCIPLIAKQARKLTVFQRTPSFSVPNGNEPLSPERVAELKRDIKAIREICRWSTIGQPYDWSNQKALASTPEERHARFEADWRKGGFEWMFGSYNDLLSSKEANDLAAEFVRDKIREIVKDPEVARRLTPTGYPIATKRLPLDNGYFQTFNRDNVELVDLREIPIECIVETGVKTSERIHKLDAIVFATGFDALTGPLLRVGICGRGREKLQSKWADGPQTYLGVCTRGFPNMFMVTGPGSPSVLGNMPVSIEQHVDWICEAIKYMRQRGVQLMEPTVEAERKWGEHVKELADATLFTSTDSWYMGANVPGKPRVFLPYIGGFGTYRKLCKSVADKDYEGFEFS